MIPAVAHTFGGWHGKGKGVVLKIIQAATKETKTENHPDVQQELWGELSYLQADITSTQLLRVLDAGFHTTATPKRPRLDSAGNILQQSHIH